jgi:D-alanyl-D-alanine carboxypeptidase
LPRANAMLRRSFLFFSPSLVGCAASPAGVKETSAPKESAAPSAPSSEPPNELALQADELFAKATKEGRFSGSIIVVDGGKIVLEKSYGLADRDATKANANDGIYRVGSLTKQFTATAILALAEEGKLSVDDAITKHVPELPPENFVDVSLRHLLSHTSGIGDARSTTWFKAHAWFSTIDPKEYVAIGGALPMRRKPGAKFEYNNWGYYLLGLVVERVSGKTFAEFMAERFFDPLGMKDTGVLRSALTAAQQARIPHGYEDSDEDGELDTLDDSRRFVDRDMTMAFGSGQILSTAADLAKWDRALAEKKVLPKLQDQLFTPVLDDYGFGWVVETRDGVPIQWHNGALSPLGFTSLIVRVPAKDRFVAYLANLDLPLVQPIEEKVIALAAK